MYVDRASLVGQLMDDLLSRIYVALSAPDRFRRLTHFIIAQILFHVPMTIRRWMFAGTAYVCPVCESSLRQFLVLHRPYHRWCPVCRSLQRHRLIWLFYQRAVLPAHPTPSSILHFAPEPGLTGRFMRLPNIVYVSADLHNPAAMIRTDICAIPIADAAFDIVQCSHVLEHIVDDARAVHEIRRVLKTDGHALILVPMTAGPTTTGQPITDPVKRERLFGQFDHVRNYGEDFPIWLERAGFDVTCLSATDVVPDHEIARFGLSRSDTLFWCQKRDEPGEG